MTQKRGWGNWVQLQGRGNQNEVRLWQNHVCGRLSRMSSGNGAWDRCGWWFDLERTFTGWPFSPLAMAMRCSHPGQGPGGQSRTASWRRWDVKYISFIDMDCAWIFIDMDIDNMRGGTSLVCQPFHYATGTTQVSGYFWRVLMDTAWMLAKTTDCSVISCDIELHMICQIIWDLHGIMSPDDNAGLSSTL